MGNMCSGPADSSDDVQLDPLVKIIDQILLTDVKVPQTERPANIKYGTAGFRTLGSQLDLVCFRVGILVGLRARLTGRAGVMITASHNPPQDNGVKIIESDGSMLNQAWEPLAELIVNAEDIRKFLTNFNEEQNREQYGFTEDIFKAQDEDNMPVVLLGMDTRESSQNLLRWTKEGIKSVGVNYVDFGLCTTPMLHWFVANDITNSA